MKNTAKKATKSATKKSNVTSITTGKKQAKVVEIRTGHMDNFVIQPLIKENPCRKDTFCHAEVAAALSSRTVGEAQKKLDKSGLNPENRRIEVGWMVRMRYIKVKANGTKKAA